MRLLSLGLLLLVLFSCEEEKVSSQEFFQKELISAYSFHELNEGLVNSDELKLAQGAWGAALRVSVYGDQFERADYCLLVKKPLGLEPGLLRFVQANDFEASCVDYLFAPEALAELEFYNIFIELKNKKLSLKVDEKVLIYPLFNKNNEYGVAISPSIEETRPFKRSLKDGSFCHEVNDNCSSSEDRCSDCVNGSYYFKTSSCSRKLSRICGRDNCGHRGQPACIRGEVSTGVKTYCIQDSPVGFCVGRARVACVNGKLICE